MNVFKQIVGVVHILIAAIVAIHTVIEPALLHLHRCEPVQFNLGYNQPAYCGCHYPGVDIRLLSHETCRRKCERSRVHRGEHAILRISVRRHTLFLELVRHQWRRERIYRSQCRCPIDRMDFL